MLDIVRQHYPNATTADNGAQYFIGTILTEFNIPPNQVLLANSICSDDVNNIDYPPSARQMLGPFNMGGLDGFPFAGLTGMGAFAHHVPDGGAVFIFYGPHIGINKKGEIGKIRRVGQQSDSGCCGAAAAALGKLQRGEIAPGEKPDNDYQQASLEQILYAQKEQVLNAEYPLIEATNAIFEASNARLNELIEKTSFLGNYIFLGGAIIINADFDAGIYLSIKRFDVLDAKTKKVIRTLPG